MRTQAERLEAMHARAGEIRRQRERRAMAALSLSCVVILAGLLAVVSQCAVVHPGLGSDGYTGSSLLDSSVGGYILVGVLSFALAVIITVLCIRYRSRTRKWDSDIELPEERSQE